MSPPTSRPMPPRVTILTSVHSAFDTRVFQKQARSLAAAGFAVTLVVPHERDETVDGVRLRAVRRINHRLRRVLLSPIQIVLEALKLPSDVYHFHDPELLPAGLLLKLVGKRVIYDVHEDVPKSLHSRTYLPRALVGTIALAVGAFEKAATRAFDLVVLARDDILESFARHPRTLLIRNYPSRAAFPSVIPTERADDTFRVAYVGGLTAGRGAAEMVEAIGRVPARCQARLMILGTFWPDTLESEVRAMEGFARVDYRGWLPYDQVPKALTEADAGIVCFLPEPNHVNAGPTKLFEYMACGLPVVASNFPMWRGVIEGNDCGICVDPADPSAIAEAIEFLADHPDRRREMGANGRRAVLEKYNWEAEAARLVEAYGQLLAPPAA
jgi:glycosyltransferase involved in cell wall biosynthesis